MAAHLDSPAHAGHQQRIEQAEIEIDNLRAAFAWSRENSETALALQLASSLVPLWFARGRIQEGRIWFGAALVDGARDLDVPPAVRARALADTAMLGASVGATTEIIDQAEQALAIAAKSVTPPCWPGR